MVSGVTVVGHGPIELSKIEVRTPDGGTRRASRSAVENWIRRGLRRPDGSRVKLSTFRVGSRRFTTVEALKDFFASLDDSAAPPHDRTPAQRDRDAERADRELAAAGW